MSDEKIFVGRKAELEQFKKVLEDPQGQAILVVGHRGMGKTWLVNKMAELAGSHPNLKCGHVRYEVTPTDSVDSTMALMMDNAFEAAQIEEGSFVETKRRLEQWRSILNVINIGDLVLSLRRDPAKNTRGQFLERLQLISKHMPENGRAIFIIDPEKYMQKDSDQSWAIVVKELPDKIKLIFAQRTEDVLVESETFATLDNILYVPEKRLGVLEDRAVDELLNQRVSNMDYTVTEVRKILSKYQGHPYALQGALDLLKAGKKLEELPQDPTPTGIAAIQWKEICKKGKDAIRLFKAYAILEVGVPDDVVSTVCELDSDTLQGAQVDNYLVELLREESYGKRLYHTILSDYILDQMTEDEKKAYHCRAVQVYSKKLEDAKIQRIRPDALAAIRLAEHVLTADGEEAFVHALENRCVRPLINLGQLDTAIGLSERALLFVVKGSTEEARVLSNLGVLHKMHGNLKKAERMHQKALGINMKLGRLESMARNYGNLGLVYKRKKELEKAEEMVRKSLEINEKIGRLEGVALQYGNLGLICQSRGDLDEAERMFKRSLQISETQGMIELDANQYGNLGSVYINRGDLDKGEQLIRKALEINKKLGRLGGMANQYVELGLVRKEQGEVDKAREYWKEALSLYEKVGMKLEIEKTQQLLDGPEGK